ncbi:MAG: hypothetical protein M3R02_27665 [Chloroflexota bacterium]|nr:hypothetical protein [Chloroflexota bacterium]
MSRSERPASSTKEIAGPSEIVAALTGHSNDERRQGTPPIVARAVRVEPGNVTRVVVVACPYCQQEHRHQWPVGMADVGPRIAPCSLRPPADMRRCYWIETADGGDLR